MTDNKKDPTTCDRCNESILNCCCYPDPNREFDEEEKRRNW